MKLLQILSFAFFLQFNSVASAASVSNLSVTKLVKCAALLTLSLSSPSDVFGVSNPEGGAVEKRDLRKRMKKCPNKRPLKKVGRKCKFDESCKYEEECCFKEVRGQGRCEYTCGPKLVCACLGGNFACKPSEFCMITTTDPTCECEGDRIRCP